MNTNRLVSCIMPTYNRRQFIPHAIEYFLNQDYANRELIILDDGSDAINDLVPADERILYVRLEEKITLGAKRNTACEHARGEIIAHWDDDDWHASHRLSYQVEMLLREGADVCGLNTLLFYDIRSGAAWQYVYPSNHKVWLSGSTLCYTRRYWESNRFENINVGEDARFVWSKSSQRLFVLTDYTFHVGLIHSNNISPKNTNSPYWRSFPANEVKQLMGDDCRFHDELAAKKKQISFDTTTNEPTALVSAAFGIGDILRITPLIRVFARLGYQVDVLLAPDYAETVKLLEGAPEIRKTLFYKNFRSNKGHEPFPDLNEESYDIATFTVWSAPLRRWVKARETHVFPQQQWLKAGDISCVEQIAREVGWTDALPDPFAMSSSRKFNLAPNTIALHPGCKPDWPWKKWHGFSELADLWTNVVIVGTAADNQNGETYFRFPFKWSSHVKNFAGELSLIDTAALLNECSALVSNDSGLMHMGVALGIPTFGVFGITNPQREIIPSRKMFPITKALTCEPQCRKQSWGRRDCEHHLACLRTLTPQEVFAQIEEKLKPERMLQEEHSREVTVMDELCVTYYGYVFDASGYGHAARAYIHALHRAGVKLSVVDLAKHEHQVHDDLVESLFRKPLQPDFHLFHGIPPQWAREAFQLSNVIGMTVWETDAMPWQWRNVLNHVLEVWVPCDFNVDVFRTSLEKRVFKLPHPLLPPQSDGHATDASQSLSQKSDFLFYSIFEWQERKGPNELIAAFCRAFPTEQNVKLIIKTNPNAAGVARQTLQKWRQQTKSQAQVELRCEAWRDAQIEDLHARGDCYVSLHRGEGWGYPLFEAASRGTPVIATGFSGPLEYLNTEDHLLVRYQIASVRQPYAYYQPQMHWAEPDCTHAAELMRQVYEQQTVIKQRAVTAASRIQDDYSLESVGQIARQRLIQLLQRTQPEKWKRLQRNERKKHLPAAIPISGDWYDANYFDNGSKSNWEQGYSWISFSSLFKETSAFLTDIFGESHSFLDVGCAKGFLMRALIEHGKECHGFDHSRWAIDRVEEIAKPFAECATVDDVTIERKFDMLLAFSIFESLSEEQALSFLSRARQWTQHALFAVILSPESEAELEHLRDSDSDLSHITLKPRAWWCELFLRAGWRQDAVHKIVERLCQNHPLPTKMGWQVYLYVPE